MRWPLFFKHINLELVAMVSIVALATWLRFWHLDTKAIFFGDAARDVTVAWEALQNRSVPLLGTPSSVPRFHQGPITIWIQMIVMFFVGPSILGLSLVFAGLSMAAVIFMYWLINSYGTQKWAFLTLVLMAFSPLAIAHARMPYHITPLPLMIGCWLWALIRFNQHKPHALAWLGLAWVGVFQFELAMVPLVLVGGWYVWQDRSRLNRRSLVELLGAVSLGLLPQLVYDFSHNFSHLGGFGIWVIYRLVGTTGVVGSHTFNLSHIMTGLHQFWIFGSRMWSLNPDGLAVIGLGTVIMALVWAGRLVSQKKAPVLVEVTLLSALVLTVGYLIHGSPSEAYFPPFLVLWPVLVGWWLSTLKQPWTMLSWLGIACWAVVMTVTIPRQGFFVSTSHAFNYGAGVGEQRAVIDYLRQHSPTLLLSSTNPGSVFPSYFDNYRWWAWQKNVNLDDQSGRSFWLETKPIFDQYPTMKATHFETVILYEIEK